MGRPDAVRINAAVPLDDLKRIMGAIQKYAETNGLHVSENSTDAVQHILENPFDITRIERLAEDHLVDDKLFLSIAVFLHKEKRLPRNIQEVEQSLAESALVYQQSQNSSSNATAHTS